MGSDCSRNSPYLCRQINNLSARTGGASAIRASSIAFGLHCPCQQNSKHNEYEKNNMYSDDAASDGAGTDS